MICDCRFRNCRLMRSQNAVSQFGNPQSSIAIPFGGPRGSRTHYLSIKSRELILMSFRPNSISDLDFGLDTAQSAIQNPQSAILMLRPRLELGSRTDLVLAGYKPALCQLSYRSSQSEISNLKSQIVSQISNLKFEIPKCARRDSNPPPRFKKPVLRHQSFERMALAAGFEPALTALEEQRLVPLGHASIQTSAGSTRFELAYS